MRFILAFVLLISINGFSQYKDFKIGPKGDTLNRIDMQGRKQGPWIVHVDDLRGERGYEEEGYFEKDKKEGKWRRFSLDGDILAIENYRWGNLDGRNFYYSNMGDLLREETWRAINPDNPYDTVPVYDIKDPTKIVRMEVIKVEGISYKHGIWKYYDASAGTIAKTEKWFMNKPATGDGDNLRPIDDLALDGAGKPKYDTTGRSNIPKPKEILDFEKKNSGKKKIKVRDGSTGN